MHLTLKTSSEMTLKRIIKWALICFMLLSLSMLIMLAIGQFQLYLLTSIDSPKDIKVGYPYPYYSFSRDGNNFHGVNGKNLILDYSLTLAVVTIGYVLIKIMSARFLKK